MSIEGLKKAYWLEENYLYKAIHPREKSEGVIQEVEAFLNLKIPLTFRYYLKYLSSNSSIKDFKWIFNPINRVPSLKEILDNSSLVQDNLEYREDPNLTLKPHELLIESEVPDCMYILDTNNVKENQDCPVMGWWGEPDGQIYPDFDLFYLEILVGYIRDVFRSNQDEEMAEAFIADYKRLGFKVDEIRFISDMEQYIRNAFVKYDKNRPRLPKFN